jgi:hypothetical protein
MQESQHCGQSCKNLSTVVSHARISAQRTVWCQLIRSTHVFQLQVAMNALLIMHRFNSADKTMEQPLSFSKTQLFL